MQPASSSRNGRRPASRFVFRGREGVPGRSLSGAVPPRWRTRMTLGWLWLQFRRRYRDLSGFGHLRRAARTGNVMAVMAPVSLFPPRAFGASEGLVTGTKVALITDYGSESNSWEQGESVSRRANVRAPQYICIENIVGHRPKAGVSLHRPSQPSQPSRRVDCDRHPRKPLWLFPSPSSGLGARTQHTTLVFPRCGETSRREPFLLPRPWGPLSMGIEKRGSRHHRRPSSPQAWPGGPVLGFEPVEQSHFVFEAARPRDPKDRNRCGSGLWFWLGGRRWARLGSPATPRARAQPGRGCRGSTSGSHLLASLLRL